MVERFLRKEEAKGSIPLISIQTFLFGFFPWNFLLESIKAKIYWQCAPMC